MLHHRDRLTLFALRAVRDLLLAAFILAVIWTLVSPPGRHASVPAAPPERPAVAR